MSIGNPHHLTLKRAALNSQLNLIARAYARSYHASSDVELDRHVLQHTYAETWITKGGSSWVRCSGLATHGSRQSLPNSTTRCPTGLPDAPRVTWVGVTSLTSPLVCYDARPCMVTKDKDRSESRPSMCQPSVIPRYAFAPQVQHTLLTRMHPCVSRRHHTKCARTFMVPRFRSALAMRLLCTRVSVPLVSRDLSNLICIMRAHIVPAPPKGMMPKWALSQYKDSLPKKSKWI